MTIEDAESSRPLLFRAGYILPMVPEDRLPRKLNTATLRRVPIDLWVLPNQTGSAVGDLYFDAGDSINPVGKNSNR